MEAEAEKVEKKNHEEQCFEKMESKRGCDSWKNKFAKGSGIDDEEMRGMSTTNIDV